MKLSSRSLSLSLRSVTVALAVACVTACGGDPVFTDTGSDIAMDGATVDASSDARIADTGLDAIDVAPGDSATSDSRDASARDAVDAPVRVDVADAHAADSGGRTDVATSCPSDLGMACDAICPAGLQCSGGFCTPQGREQCGGFAGAPCTDATYSQCLYFAGADFGVCVSSSEEECLCMRASAAFSSCP